MNEEITKKDFEKLKCKITIVWKEQEKAIQLWKELVEEWFKFKWKWLYIKKKFTFQIWYDETLEKEYFREVKFW